MIKKITILITSFIFILGLNIGLSTKLYAETKDDNQISIILEELESLRASETYEQEIEYYLDHGDKDRRVAVIKAFFRRYDSPLYEHSQFIVDMADQYQLDYRLIPAIAMQESTACKFIPKNSHNCWGWGIYGTTVTRFSSYPEAIETISRGLKNNYVDKGLKTPEQIMSKYTPSSNGSWARGVSTVLGVLE